ncbi:MAG TPA: GAF domain-containing protein, partial [Anaerolineae bacterium]
DIVERAGHLVETENGYVYLVEPGGDEMELRVGTGLYDDIVGARTRPGVGLAGLVWQSSQPLVLDDYQKWPQRLAGARRDLLRAVVGVPLKSGEQTVGVIGLAYTEPDRKFGDNEMDVLSRFAQLAAVALDNVRLYQETQHSVTELRTLNNISQVLASQRDLHEMCKQVVEELTRSFEASSGYVALYDAATRTIEIPYLLDRHQPQPVEPIPLGEGLTSLVITSRQPLLINTDTVERARELGARVAGEPPLSFLAVPILSGSDVIGVVSVQSAEGERLLTREDENLLTTVAANLSVALQSVNLFQALQVELEERQRARDALEKSNQYLNSLQTTSLGLVARLEVNELLRDIVTRAGDLVGSENGYVYIVDPAANEMEMRVGTGLYDDLVGVRARPGAGLAGQVWETGEPLAIDDYQKWPARLPGARRDLLRGVVGVPLRSGDRTAGVIGLAYTDPERKFGANELDVLGRFAQLAAIALDNAQLHQETASRLDEVVALNSISQALTTQLAVKELSKLIIERLREIMPEANAYLISLYDKRTNRVSIPYSLEGEVVQVVEPFPLGQGVSSYIIQNAKPVFINRDAERRVRELGALTVGEPAQSFIGVPVMAGNEVIGMLSVQNVERAGLFDDNDLRLLETIASNLGVALRNAQLFEETRRAQTFLDSVVENLPFMVWVKEAGELRYVSVNKAFEDILGMTRGELLGKNAFDLFKRDEAERYTAQDQELMKGPSLLDVPEELVESRTKGVRILHTQKIPIYGSDGKPAYLLAIAEDITERKKANEERAAFERKLLETQKLESLGVLAGGIAHDFNNLLVSILGNVGLALLDLEPASPAREPVEQIKVAAQRAADLTKQMLAYSGKGRFVMQRLNVNAIIEEMTQLLRVSISKNAMLRMNLTPHLPPIEADATQVRQIVMNLIVNASDAIGARDGIITLNTGTVRVDPRYLSDTFMAPELTAGDYVFIEVADTGVGMDSETQKKIFEPFFTTKFTGRGLGLAAVLGIVRGHKGAIKVASDPGKGTTFRILLPSSEGSSAMDEGAKVNQIERGQGIVLVVDDEDVVRNVTKRMLERFGYGVMMASDGREGVDVYKTSMDRIALVLLDMTMPHMNGEETFRELRVIRPEVKVLLMSGYTEQEATSRFAGKGLAGFLQKPYTPQELHEKIQSILK